MFKRRLIAVVTLGLAGLTIGSPQAHAVTQTPTLNKPLASTTYISGVNNMPIKYTLPEAYSSLTVKWELTSDAASNFRIITLKPGLGLTRELTLFDALGTTASIEAVSGTSTEIATISTTVAGLTSTGEMPTGNYTVTVSYSNAGADPAATAQATGVNLARKCEVGSYSTDGNTPCTLAAKGYYVAAPAATSQTACIDGTYSETQGSMTCFESTAGHYAAADHQSQIPCSVGSYQAETRKTSCVTASAGYYVSAPGATAQVRCAGGWDSLAGATTCTIAIFTTTPSLTSPSTSATVVRGSAETAVNFILPQDYLPGSVTLTLTLSTDATTHRTFVLTDATATAQTIAAFDMRAPNSSVTANVAFVSVVTTIANVADNDSRLPPGRYTVAISYQNSHSDPVASASSSDVLLTESCGLGYYSSSGNFPCDPAAVGTYVAFTGSTTASTCPDGSYNETLGSIMCMWAPAGSYAYPDHTGTARCAKGTYQPNAQKSSCITASPGHYVDIVGAMEQLPCPSGTSSAAGAVSCTPIETPTTAPTTSIPGSANSASSGGSSSPVTATTTTTTTTSTVGAGTAESLRTPTAPTVARKVGVKRSFVVAARNQKTSTGLTVTMTSKSKTCRVTKTTKGFVVTGVKKGSCTLSIKIAGNSVYRSVAFTSSVIVS